MNTMNSGRCFRNASSAPRIASRVQLHRVGRVAVVPKAAIKLYTNPGSRGKITEWYLAELGVPFETKLLDMRAGEHKTPQYLAINPFGKVPALEDGDLKLFESGAILLHLANKYGKVSPDMFGKACQWTLFANSTLSDAFFNERQRATQMPVMLLTLDSLLSKQPFLEGEFSVSDIAVGSYLLYLPLFFPQMFSPGPESVPQKYPNVWKYMQAIAARPTCPSSYTEALAKAVEALKPAAGGGGGGPFGGLFGGKK